MPHRRLVQIAKQAPAAPTEPLLTIAEYFRNLAQRQGEDIQLLKERAQSFADLRASRKADSARHKSVREESWRLHPVVEVGHANKKPSRPGLKKQSSANKPKTARAPKSARAKRH